MQLIDADRSRVGSSEAFSAWAYHLKGEQETARGLAQRCIERLSNLPPTTGQLRGFELINLGICYVFAGEPELAVRAANEARAVLPTSEDLYHGSHIENNRVQILAMAGEREEALREIERLLDAPYPINKRRLYQDVRWDFFRDDERFNDLVRPDGVEAP
jgi:tetratricopeptide (TPR) repeat protein